MKLTVLLLLTCGAVGSARAQTGATNGEWRYYGGDAGNTRYTPLARITPDNVGELEIAWRWKSDNFGPRPEYNYRVTPIMVGGVLYATAGYRRAVVAIDAATGETRWTWRLDEGERMESAPRLNSGRGVAYWEDGADRRIFVVTPGYFLVALTAETGLPVDGFGHHGIIDLKKGLGREVDSVTARIGSSSPPTIVNDVLVIGAAFPSGAAPPSRTMPPGHVRGFDARTGEQLWTFHTIPQPSDPGVETWEGDSWTYTGNTGVWAPMAADEALGLVYLPVEAPTGDYYGGHRLGDNLYSQSLVALDAATGERVWHFQMVHHGIWDYDPPAPPILGEVTVDGARLPVVMQVTKQAFTYTFDRRTGTPVWPIEERPVPQSDTPGERTAPTQPFPTRPPPFDRQGVTVDDLIDFTPALRAEAVELVRQFRTGSLYTPPSVADSTGTLGTLSLPGSLGGANWPGGAFDPETGLLYVQSVTAPTILGLVRRPDRSDMEFVRGGPGRLPRGVGPQGLPIIQPPWGRITAIDMNAGVHAWMIPNADTPEFVTNHPALAGLEIPRTGRPDRGGMLVTATLVLAGEGGGMFAAQGGGGNTLRAHDKSTGAILAEFELPANQTGLPMSYEVDGVQYVVVAVGGPRHPGELVALRLRARGS